MFNARPSHTVIRGLIAACAITLLAASPVASAAKPPKEWDGLELRDSKRFDRVYARPGASLAGYKRVRLEALQVAFDKDWDPNRDQRSPSHRLSAQDFEDIKTGLATEFAKVFAEELTKGGYSIATEPGEDVLDITPFIIDLYITAPDTSMQTAGRSRTYVADSGHMTLVAEARDSVTNQVLARAIDAVQGMDTGRFQVANSVTNIADARFAIKKWATSVVKALDEFNATGAKPK